MKAGAKSYRYIPGFIHFKLLTPELVCMHRANFADFILDLRNCYSQSHLYIGFAHKYRVVTFI
jgi:hypothetical protein